MAAERGRLADRFDSITVYQRGWRLGGKGASSRGPHGRIEEHGLHVWLGCYDNAFALLRECYAELDRATTDPGAPIHTWDQAFIPPTVSASPTASAMTGWCGRGGLARNDELPGEPNATGREFTAVDFLRRALQLVLDFADSLSAPDENAGMIDSDSPDSPRSGFSVVRRGVRRRCWRRWPNHLPPEAIPSGALNHVLDAIREALDYEHRPDHRRFWLFLSLVTATVRGIDRRQPGHRSARFSRHQRRGLLCLDSAPRRPSRRAGLPPRSRAVRHGVRVRGRRRRHDRRWPRGWPLLLTGIALFQYKGAFFWKMTAGMGDVVIAPLYQALRRRGVEFEFFHRVDALHLDDRRQAVEAITMGRQVRLADGVDRLRTADHGCGGLPVFPDRAAGRTDLDGHAQSTTSESHFGAARRRRDASAAPGRRLRPRRAGRVARHGGTGRR